MKKQIGIRIETERLALIDGYCDRKGKDRTAFVEYALDLAIDKLHVKGKPFVKKRHWHGSVEAMPLYSQRKTIGV